MIDLVMYRGGLKDSEDGPNSFFPKINWTVFWRLGTDMSVKCWTSEIIAAICALLWNSHMLGKILQRERVIT